MNSFVMYLRLPAPPPPVMLVMLDAATLKTMKISCFERHLYNSAAFKARTKARSKCRDKRADVGEFF
ncbi:Interferon-related developmental regulator 1 [Vulpes lagopus]